MKCKKFSIGINDLQYVKKQYLSSYEISLENSLDSFIQKEEVSTGPNCLKK